MADSASREGCNTARNTLYNPIQSHAIGYLHLPVSHYIIFDGKVVVVLLVRSSTCSGDGKPSLIGPDKRSSDKAGWREKRLGEYRVT